MAKNIDEKQEEQPHGEAENLGGYDCDFVMPPPEDLLCRICHYPSREPLQTSCCGHNFCKTCYNRYCNSNTIEHDKCPYCREEFFETFPDRKATRQIRSMSVYCANKHQGCTWSGELSSLEKHLDDDCLFTKI